MKFEGLNNSETIDQSESGAEQIEKVETDIRNALIMQWCGDADNFDSCMDDWAKNNNEIFEDGFDRLLKLKPNFINEWESDEPAKRSEILDILNGPIIERQQEKQKAA